MTGDDPKLATYREALRAAWIAQPNATTQARYHGFVRRPNVHCYSWIRWVEKNIDVIPWCQELVLKAIELKLGLNA